MRDAVDVNVATLGLPDGHLDAVKVYKRMLLGGFLEADLVELHAIELPCLGGADPQLVRPVVGLREIKISGLVKANRLPRLLLQLTVQVHGVVLQPGNVVGVVKTVDPSGGVPGRSAGQFLSLQQHDVRHTELGQMVGDGTPNYAAANNDGFRLQFHSLCLR